MGCRCGFGAGRDVGVCKLAVKGWRVGPESDDLCPFCRVARSGERNGVGEDKVRPSSLAVSDKLKGNEAHHL